VIDPDYLTEPLVRSGLYVRSATQQLPPYPCQAEDNLPPGAQQSYKVPHYLPGENPWLTETAFKFKVPLQAWRGFAETLYPEWYDKAKTLPPPAAPDIVLKPVYDDASTHVAERADAERPRVTASDSDQPLLVTGNVFLIGGDGANTAASIGDDGVIMVETSVGGATAKVLTAIREAAAGLPPSDPPESASPFNSTWQATHAFADPKIRMIITTSDNADHVKGNAAIRASSMFGPLGDGPAYQLGTSSGSSQQNLAHVNVQQRLLDASPANAPTDTYFTDKYTLYRFFNGQAIQIFHLPRAITDGDSIVHFRRTDVIVTGDIFTTTQYPFIDVKNGGSLQGEIQALNFILDRTVYQHDEDGGTLIIPGHGRVTNEWEVAEYRDMLVIFRDRIQAMIKNGATLEQAKAARPTADYDPRYGATSGPWTTDMFVEAMYTSLKK